jgi:hypothetical protein
MEKSKKREAVHEREALRQALGPVAKNPKPAAIESKPRLCGGTGRSQAEARTTSIPTGDRP